MTRTWEQRHWAAPLKRAECCYPHFYAPQGAYVPLQSLSRSTIIKLAVIYNNSSIRSSELQSQIGLDRCNVRPARMNYLRTNGHLKRRWCLADVLRKVSGNKLTLCQPGIVQSCALTDLTNHKTRNRINTTSINSLSLRPYFIYCVKMGAEDLLAHMKVVEQARELVGAIRMLTTDQTYAHAFAVLHRCLEGNVQSTSMSSLVFTYCSCSSCLEAVLPLAILSSQSVCNTIQIDPYSPLLTRRFCSVVWNTGHLLNIFHRCHKNPIFALTFALLGQPWLLNLTPTACQLTISCGQYMVLSTTQIDAYLLVRHLDRADKWISPRAQQRITDVMCLMCECLILHWGQAHDWYDFLSVLPFCDNALCWRPSWCPWARWQAAPAKFTEDLSLMTVNGFLLDQVQWRM